MIKISGETYTRDLLSTALQYCKSEGVNPTPLPELTVIRRDRTGEATPGMYSSEVCFVLQGEKDVWVGEKMYRYNPAHFLVSCVDIPAIAQIMAASPSNPFICLKLELQPSVIYEILQNAPTTDLQQKGPDVGFFVEKVTPELADAFARLMRAVENSSDLRILSPSIVREIHYRLMSSRFGTKIRQLGIVGSKTQRIGKVLDQLRKNYAAPLKITDLARTASMSPSSFHLHFKQVTSMSPLQYQKQIRLQEARRLLSVETADAASVAFEVGYESASQFSREYRRLFGTSPMRDMERVRMLGPV